MCEFYIYKIVDNAIVGILIAMIVFYWRGAMGVGVFLNAKLINKYRQNIMKYQYYSSIAEEGFDRAYISLKENVTEKYNKSIYWHYFYSFICFGILIGVLSFAYITEEGIVGSILSQGNWVKAGSIVIFLFLMGWLLVISHTARGGIEFEDIADMKVSAMIKFIEEGKTPEEKNR